MAKSKKKQRREAKKAGKQLEKKKFVLPSIVKNFLILGGVLLLLKTLKENNAGYNWVVESQIIQSQESMKKFKDLTYQQKMEAKLGFTMRYFDFIRKNTPDTAVILMPPDTVIRPPGQVHHTKTAMNGYTTIYTWVSYFIYPRKLVYEDRKERFPQLTDKVTHVAIINKWGYNKLPYRVNQENEYSIMPIKMPQQ
ncbi:MAG: hypothetical protein H6601_09100 [Flavobacteriales bacterium]|nr:hypothetical protein [Flavobacteriales bacterium]